MGLNTSPAQERLERWAQRLENLTVSPLTRDYPEANVPEAGKRPIEAFESLKLTPDALAAVQKLSETSGSAFLAFLTAFVVLVARLTGDEDIAIGTSSADDGRPFVLRVPLEASETFNQLQEKVEKVRDQPVETYHRSRKRVLTTYRPLQKVQQISYLYETCDPTSRRNPSRNEHRSSSASPPMMLRQPPKSILRTPSRRPIS